MINGVTFSGDGPMMHGTWYNPSTGDSFTVRDSFFEDNRFVVTTTDGRMLDFSQIQHYVQSDKPIEMPEPPQTDSRNELPSEVADLVSSDLDILPEDMEILNAKPLGNLANTSQSPKYNWNETPSLPVINNYGIIEKALSKRSLPDVNVGINWFLFPSNEIKMLMDLMDVNFDEIVEWYVNQVDIEKLTIFVREAIKQHIEFQFDHPMESAVLDPEVGAFAKPSLEVADETPKSTKKEKTESSKKLGGPKTPKNTTKTKKIK